MEPGGRCLHLSSHGEISRDKQGKLNGSWSAPWKGPYLHVRNRTWITTSFSPTRMVEWRINNPPPGLWVSEVSFKFFYQSYDLLFRRKQQVIGARPDLPPGTEQSGERRFRVDKGAAQWTVGVAQTSCIHAIPPNTSLSVDSVTITDGIAEVALGRVDTRSAGCSAQPACRPDRLHPEASAGVKGVVIKVNQQPYRVPGADPNSQVISIDAIPRELDPIPSVAGEQAYAVRKGVVEQVTPSTDSPTSNPVPGP